MTEQEKPLTREEVHDVVQERGSEGLDLSEMNLGEVDLSPKPDWNPVDLRGINLYGANLKGAILSRAILEGACLCGANLEGACLCMAQLHRAQLEGAILKQAALQEACLEEANLNYANLQKSCLVGTNLNEADLRGCDFSGAKFTNVRLHKAKISRETRLYDVEWEALIGDRKGEPRCIWPGERRYILGEEREGNYEAAAEVYCELKRWYIEAGRPDVASRFNFREWEARTKSWGQSICNKCKGGCRSSVSSCSWWKDVLNWLLLILNWLWLTVLFGGLSGYGEKPLKVVRGVFVLVLGMAIVYWRLGGSIPDSFPLSLYYSAVSSIALGYGSWFKEVQFHRWAAAFGVVQAFVGVFMMALFLATIIKKVTR
jgi:hypothetical protein